MIKRFLDAQDQKARNRALLPRELPGEVAVVTRERYSNVYTLYLDDATEDQSESEYQFQDVKQLQYYLAAMGHKRDGEELIDIATEYGTAVLNLHDGRVVPDFDRRKELALDFSKGERHARNGLPQL